MGGGTSGDGTKYTTGRFVVLNSNQIAGTLLEAVKEEDDEVPDVLGVRALEHELLCPHCAEHDRLVECLGRPEKGMLTTQPGIWE